MEKFDWRAFLAQWSKELLASDLFPEKIEYTAKNSWKDETGESHFVDSKIPPNLLSSNWLGYTGATEEQIQIAETRLGVSLPPSYREFLMVTNGWRRTSDFIFELFSTEKVDWFANNYQWLIDIWTEAESEPIPDNEYFVYGEKQEPFRVKHLQTALQISQQGDQAFYLLNPRVIFPDGEWEAWFFAEWLHGARRYQSFSDLMHAEYQSFLNLNSR